VKIVVIGLLVLAALALVTFMVWRQTRERRVTPRGLVVLPLVFVAIGVLADKDMPHRLDSPLALALLVLGLLLAGALGVLRATTMTVRRDGRALVTRGTRTTVVWWIVTLAVRIGVVLLAYRLGVAEQLGEAMLFVAVTFGVQNAIVAARGGLFSAAPTPAATGAPAATDPAGGALVESAPV